MLYIKDCVKQKQAIAELTFFKKKNYKLPTNKDHHLVAPA